MSATCLFELNGRFILTLFNVKLCYWGGFTFSIWSPIRMCESMRGRRALNRTERHWLDQLCRWATCASYAKKIQNPELHFHSAYEPHPTRFCHWKTANFVQLKTSCCFSADILWRRNWVNSVSLTMMLVSVQIPLPVTLHTAHQPNVPFGPIWRAEIHTASFTDCFFTELRQVDDEKCYVAGTAASPRRDMKADWTGDYCHVSPSTKGVVEVDSTENLNWANWPVLQSCKIPQTTPNVNGKATLFDLSGFQPPLQTVLPSPSKSFNAFKM